MLCLAVPHQCQRTLVITLVCHVIKHLALLLELAVELETGSLLQLCCQSNLLLRLFLESNNSSSQFSLHDHFH
eukprot:12930451-Prorocentrum_lima.AAC.1